MNTSLHSLRSLGFAALTAAYLLPAAAVAQATATMPATGPKPVAGAPADMKQAMAKGMADMQKMPMSGDTDKDFAMMMKMHHQQALDMAQMEIDHGKSPEMKKMAKDIVTAQKKEIAQFDMWLAKQK